MRHAPWNSHLRTYPIFRGTSRRQFRQGGSGRHDRQPNDQFADSQAARDLDLARRGYLEKEKRGKAFCFHPAENLAKRLKILS